jgi:hypothetical protein
MSNTTDTRIATKELEILQDIFIFLLLDASVPQQTVRKIARVDLKRATRIGKLLRAKRQEKL